MSAARILVTGAASGIGAATCAALARDGYDTIAADVRPSDTVMRLDVRDEASWDETMTRIGHVDGLVTCAGIRTRGAVNELSVSQFDDVFAVNVRGAFLGIRAVSRQWIETGSPGAIVTVASINGYMAVPGQAHYAASKAAMIMLTKAAALDLAPIGIRVNAVAPGAIRTPMIADRLEEPGQEERLSARIPLGRVGAADDVTPAIAFLLSDGARYITGTTLLVDGGWAFTA